MITLLLSLSKNFSFWKSSSITFISLIHYYCVALRCSALTSKLTGNCENSFQFFFRLREKMLSIPRISPDNRHFFCVIFLRRFFSSIFLVYNSAERGKVSRVTQCVRFNKRLNFIHLFFFSQIVWCFFHFHVHFRFLWSSMRFSMIFFFRWCSCCFWFSKLIVGRSSPKLPLLFFCFVCVVLCSVFVFWDFDFYIFSVLFSVCGWLRCCDVCPFVRPSVCLLSFLVIHFNVEAQLMVLLPLLLSSLLAVFV